MSNKILFWSFAIVGLLLTLPSALAALDDGLVSFWTMDNNDTDGSIMVDVVDGNNGSINSVTTGIAGKINEAYNSTTAGNDVTVGHASNLMPTNISVGFWFKPSVTNGDTKVILHKGDFSNGYYFDAKSSQIRFDIGGSFTPATSSSVLTVNTWVFVVGTWDGSTERLYINGTEVDNGSATGVGTSTNDLVFFERSDVANTQNSFGGMDAVGIWNRTLDASEVSELYNSGVGRQAPFVSDAPVIGVINISPSVPDSDDNITSNASVTTGEGGDYNLTTNVYFNGVLNKTTNHGELANGTATIESFDCSTLSCSDGDNVTFEYEASNVDGSDSRNESVEIQDQGFIEVQAFEKISGSAISVFNSTSPENASTSNGTLTIQTDVGTRTLTIDAGESGYLNTITNSSVVVVKQQTTSVNVSGFYTANVTLNVTDGNNGSVVNNLSISLSSNDYSFEENKTNAVSGSIYNLINGSYDLSISHPLYADFSSTINVTGSETLDIELYPDPSSVRVTVRQEEDGSILNENITLTVSNDIGEQVFDIVEGVDNGTKFVGNLTPDNYTFKFQASGFSTRSYALEVGEDTTQSLTAYMAATNQTVIFTVIDDNTLAPIPSSDVLIERSINGSWTTVENRKTDVTGRVQFTFIIGEAYRVTADASGYTSRTFTLDPILFTSYNIPLSKTSTVESRVNARIEPVNPRFVESQTTTVNFSFVAPGGNLQSYELTWTVPDGSTVTRSGTEATGQTFTNIPIPVGVASIGDRVTLDYSYTDTDGDTTTRRESWGILTDEIGNNTFADNINQTYNGFGDFERSIVTGGVAAGAAGVGGIVAGTGGAILFSLLVYGYAAYAGIINGWMIAVTVIIGLGYLWFTGGRG